MDNSDVKVDNPSSSVSSVVAMALWKIGFLGRPCFENFLIAGFADETIIDADNIFAGWL